MLMRVRGIPISRSSGRGGKTRSNTPSWISARHSSWRLTFRPITSSRCASVYLSLTVESSPEAEQIWGAALRRRTDLDAHAETVFAKRFGQVRDRFGTSWMILAMPGS